MHAAGLQGIAVPVWVTFNIRIHSRKLQVDVTQNRCGHGASSWIDDPPYQASSLLVIIIPRRRHHLVIPHNIHDNFIAIVVTVQGVKNVTRLNIDPLHGV